ncbi:MAG: MerR family transcriptional regulator [Clostridia bacterium]|nr:MerR family transcriptional regulator [Clostridia bacterium]
MKKFFTVGETAKECGLTAEALRHYDRIGLVSPREKDKFTGYRYYDADDVVRLKTIRMLKAMAIPLDEIRRLLSLDDLKEVTEAFSHFERQAEIKIAQLNEGLDYMRRVRRVYENLCDSAKTYADGEIFIRSCPERIFLLAPQGEAPHAANLWRYHETFYRFLGKKADLFTFTDKAAVLTENGGSRLAAECITYDNTDERVTVMPAGNYLCAAGADVQKLYSSILEYAAATDKKVGSRRVDEIIISGILCWKYCVQVPFD